MTQLPPFRTRQPQSSTSPRPSDDFGDDELPLLGEEAILERGAPPSPASVSADAPAWDIDKPEPDDETARPEPAGVVRAALQTDADEDPAERFDVAQAASLAGAWAAQYEATGRAGTRHAAGSTPPVLTDVLMDVPTRTPDIPSQPLAPALTPAEDEALAQAEVPTLTDLADASCDADTGLDASNEALAERIADNVMAALQPALRDTVLDAVRDTLAAARQRD